MWETFPERTTLVAGLTIKLHIPPPKPLQLPLPLHTDTDLEWLHLCHYLLWWHKAPGIVTFIQDEGAVGWHNNKKNEI